MPPPADAHPGVALEHGAPRGQLQRVDVGPMAVDHDDLLEALIGQALQDVRDVTDECLVVDGHRAGKVHHVGRVAVAHRRHDHDAAVGSSGRLFADLGGGPVVDLDGEVMPVLLDRANRQQRDDAAGYGLVDLGPGHVLESMRDGHVQSS